MEITIRGRHWKPPAGFRDRAEGRIRKLLRFFPSLIRAELTVTRERYRHQAEIRLHGSTVDLVTKAVDADPDVALDQVLAKQEKALARHKDRLNDKKKRGDTVRVAPAPDGESRLPRTKPASEVSLVRSRAKTPVLSADQAARALLRSRKPVLVFEERGGNGLCVAYRLGEREVGLIELE